MSRLGRIGVLFFLGGAALAAQVQLTRAQSEASSNPEKPTPLLPALDKQIMNTGADPCVNFWQYACGNFSKLYPIPSDRSGYGST